MEKDCRRRFSSFNPRDDIGIEEDVERKAGWLLKLIFLGSGSFVIYNFYPYMGDSLLQQSISLLNVKDPLFKRIGASRLTRFATDDGRRMRVVEMGGAHKLLKVLEDAKDDKTRKEALKALSALSHAVEAVEVLLEAGAIAIINATPNSVEHTEVESYKSKLLERFQELKHDHLSTGERTA